MPSAWFGLNTALSGLRTAQSALDVAAHNTANASTPGYSRQRALLRTSEPFTYPAFNRTGLPGQIGTGVTIAAIQRVRDGFLDGQINEQTALQGYWTTRQDELAKIETVFPEPAGSGLGTVLGRFWSAWEDVAADPTSSAARDALVGAAETLASRFARDSGQIRTLIDGTDHSVELRVAEINDLATRIAGLNDQIQRVVVTGDHANDLEDQRDALVEQLNAILPVRSERQADGTIIVLAEGIDLVNHGFARRMDAVDDANGHAVPTWSTGAAVTLGEGALGALVELRDTDYAGIAARLDELAKGVADAVNAAHVTGVDATGATGLALFSYVAGNEAATLTVNATIAADSRRIAASAAPGQPGDGSVAGQIADLRASLLFASGGQTAGDFYASLIGEIGSDSRQAAEMATNQGLVVSHLQRRRESISGVSLDEEAADMIRFQHAYSAAARVITTVDAMLDQLINRTGIVGR